MKPLFKLLIFSILVLQNFLFANSLSNPKKVTLQLEWKHQFEFAGFMLQLKKVITKSLD